MRKYLSTVQFLIAHFIFIFNPFYAQAQGLDSLQIESATAAADLLFYNYQYEQAAKAYEDIAAKANPERSIQIIKSHFQQALSLQNMQKAGLAADLFNLIYTKTTQNKKADAYNLALGWLAKANVFFYYKQKDSLTIAVKKADAYIAQVPEEEFCWELKAYYYYQKQNVLTEITQNVERRSTFLSAVAYIDKLKNPNNLLRGVIYERWLNISLMLEEEAEVKKILNKVKQLLKNPYFKPYKRLEAGYLNRKMIIAGFLEDSVKFEAAAKECLGFIQKNNLLETIAYAEYLQFFALIKKDVMINYPAARQTYRTLLDLRQRRPDVVGTGLNISVSLNYAYTQMDNVFDTMGLDTGTLILENIWQECISPAHRNNNWAEYPDLSQAGVRIVSLQECTLVLQALTYAYNTCYHRRGEEKYKKALFNTLAASENLLMQTLKTTSNEQQRSYLSNTVEEFLIRKVLIYQSLYKKNPSPIYLNELWQIAQQCNGRQSRYRQNEEKALEIAQVDKKLANLYLGGKKSLENALFALSVAQKDNNMVQAAAQSQQITLITQQIADVQKQIAADYPLFAKMLADLGWVKMEELRPWLNNSALIVHYVGREKSYQILLTADTVICYNYEMQRERIGRKLVDSLNIFLNNPPTETAVEKIYKAQFERLLIRAKDTFFRQWAYLEKQNIKNVIIVPDELTAAIPFEILLTAGGNKDKPYQQWAWAANKYTFQYLPSLSFWKQSRQQSQANTHNGKVLAFAPTYQNGVENKQRDKDLIWLRKNLNELAGAKRELANLEKYYYGDFYSGGEATEAIFKAKSKEAYSIIHFAMHGLLDENLPEMSSLAFSETVDTMEDNFLSAYEIAKLPQRCQLVVLSACETAKGKRQMGEGVMSLAQYFMYGGAPAVIATRWQVNDQATAFIMQNFYKYLYEGQTIKAALKASQLDYLKQARGDGAHPFYWAAFTNIGNTDAAVYVAPRHWAMRYWIIGSVSLLLLSLWGWWKFRKRE